MIRNFTGDNEFLSNFYPCIIELDGEKYPSVEHAYQASKFHDHNMRDAIKRASTAARAKSLGRSNGMLKTHGQDRVKTMTDLVRKKFQHPELRSKLLATGSHTLIEGNNWGDTFWGMYNGVGENRLGQILMQVRKELQDAGEDQT